MASSHPLSLQPANASGYNEQTDQLTPIRTSFGFTPPFVRKMASGPCTALWVTGKRKTQCGCPNGIYEVPLGDMTPDTPCTDCAHPLSMHEEFSPAPALDALQSKLLITDFPNNIIANGALC